MQFNIVEPSAIPGNWTWMRELLAPAIAIDDERDEKDVLEALSQGDMTAYAVNGDVRGLIVTQRTGPWLWLIYAAGRIGAPRSKNIGRMMGALEYAARRIECGQIHIIGRDGWVRALKPMGYELIGHVRGRAHVRKVL